MSGRVTRGRKLGLPVLLALTTLPAIVIGAGLWLLADLVPQCTPELRETLVSPDGTRELVVFGLDCGTTAGVNTQAAVQPAGQVFSEETAETFFATDGRHDLGARWTGNDAIEIVLPDAEIRRQAESVAGVAVSYR